jgi:hypothetical protein
MTFHPFDVTLLENLAGLDSDAVKQACEDNLIDLTAYLWDIADPGEPLVGGWAMDAIADHLEATYYDHIKRLLITVPPGFSKSSLTNVFFPLWVWLRTPHARFISASYESGIPERDNLKCRRLIAHEKWQRFWGDRFKLIVPNTVDRFENDRTGWKMATAVGAKLIGYRGNYILIDDPNDPDVENQSGLKRVQAVRWFREVVPTRLNNVSRDKIIVIQQRLHMEDVAGTALSLEHENYVHLNIPMEYEPRVYIQAWTPPEAGSDPSTPDQIITLFDETAEAAVAVNPDCIFWQDPRTQSGELAWPERFPALYVAKLKKTLGKTMASAQLQQRPVPRGGNIIKTESWKLWQNETYPTFSFILATLDTAYTEDTANDPSGLCIWGLFHDVPEVRELRYTDRMGNQLPAPPEESGNPKVMLIYAWTDWLELNDLVRRVLHTCTRPRDPNLLVDYGKDLIGIPRFPVDTLVIEGKASGLSVQQEIVRLTSQGRGRTLFVDMLPAKLLRDDKLSRLVSVSHLFENEVVWAPDKEFATKVIDQVGNFPYAGHDEFCDCTSMALRWFRDRGFAPTREELVEEMDIAKSFRPAPPPLYGGI